MATAVRREGGDKVSGNTDLLLHPELLSLEFMHMVLNERNISAGEGESRDRLTELYLRHVIPLPQRPLPNTRWGRRMEKRRGRQTNSSSHNHSRKRPPIVFDGNSSSPHPLKVKRPEGIAVTTGITDRLKPPPTANLSNPIRKLSSTTTPSSPSPHTVSATQTSSAKRDADNSGVSKSPEMKTKIQRVTWP